MNKILTKVGEGGRLVIPAEYRKALGVEVGDEVVLTLDEGSLRILTPREGIRRAQERVRSYIPHGQQLAEELIADRHGEKPR